MEYVPKIKYGVLLLCVFFLDFATLAQATKLTKKDLDDVALVKTLPGFANGNVKVNSINMHYVVGGSGQPLVLLPGWPETWWSFRKIMPALAKRYKVIAVDIRGMGGSDKPDGGYDKKNMAKDIHELVKSLGYEKAFIAGHDIGAQVAWSFAANYPQATAKLVMLDVPHPDEGWLSIPMLPALGTFGDKLDEAHPYLWWFAFHQVKEMPEKILQGRAHLEHEWFFKYLLYDESAIGQLDRAVYAAAYEQPGGIRSGNAWYQAFPQDIQDEKTYQKLQMPVLGIAGPGYGWLTAALSNKTANLKMAKAEGSGHFVAEEKPQAVVDFMINFLQ